MIPKPNCHWTWAWTREVQWPPWMLCLYWAWVQQRIDWKGQGFRLQIIKMMIHSGVLIVGIGQSFSMSAEQLAQGEQAICTLYGKKQLTNVKTARHRMFGTQIPDPCRLPPCQGAAQNHLRRVIYQAAIWRMCLENCPDTLTTWSCLGSHRLWSCHQVARWPARNYASHGMCQPQIQNVWTRGALVRKMDLTA